MKHGSFISILLLACTPVAPQLSTGTQVVTKAAPAGPTCLERCTVAKANCGELISSTCAACDGGNADDVRTCLSNNTADCLESASCLRAPPSRGFAPGPYGTAVKDVAGPVALETTEGRWRLEAQWTGDDSFLFLMRTNGNAALFNGSLKALLDGSPRNVQYVFGFLNDDSGFGALRTRWTAELAQLPEADRRHWTPRVHFVLTKMDAVDGWVGQMMAARLANPPRYLGNGLDAFAIDRQQRIREVGMLGRLGGSGTVPDLRLLAKEAEAFNFEFDREQRLASRAARVITVATKQTAHDTIEADVMLPTAAELDGYDTLEVDLAMDCPDHLSANCGAWDYLSHLYRCTPSTGADGGAAFACDQELARWITSYWREGRWVTDISYQLPALKPGGLTHLKWWASPQFDPRSTDYITSLSLRFSNQGRAQKPVSATPLWTGGNLRPGYDALHPSRQVDVPADAVRVELVTLLTGHGGVAPTNCAEFCNHQHVFGINGMVQRQSFPEATTPMGCADRVNAGVVPNQHGTWYYGRGGWCPGFDVAPFVVDVTSAIRKGQPNTLTYQAQFGGQPVSQDLGNIVLSSWLVVWK